ncbi:hypothetical protein CVT91_04300 [Candidatus Atribacteria bacterium HGW-Atribacteria-1]|nr:MAG: hypothetical protein CVT91_04300 [Candidatus Atribacteria bacterium HGW-Atribacteria-1]
MDREIKIIISHYPGGKSQRQISKELNINRRTINKYIENYENKKARLTSFLKVTVIKMN